MKVVTFGELMIRLQPYNYERFVQADHLEFTFGGGEANVAVSLANYGLDAAYVTKLPAHAIGQAAVNSLRRYGVDTSMIVRGGDRVGIYFNEKGASQRGSVCIYDRAHSAIQESQPSDFDWDKIFEGVDWFHFTGITPALGPNLVETCKQACKAAKAHGVNKIALEMHQGFCVYNTYTLKKLREAVGPEIGANLDPSHLIWQGMDPIQVIRALGGEAIFHVHAKDTKIDPINAPIDGTLDYRPYGDEIHRSWIFRSIGYGHDELFWKDFVSQLRLVGYDYVLSIEHEDSLMSKNEGLVKACDVLKRAITFEDKMTEARWF